MQIPSKSKDIVPQFSHALIFDLKELNPINTKINIKRGIKSNKIRILPSKLMKKLIPIIGINISMINE
tara:strand:+ start:92 stop:295 length:204 start_codon:yes stop_codon:yes gene_type:complete